MLAKRAFDDSDSDSDDDDDGTGSESEDADPDEGEGDGGFDLADLRARSEFLFDEDIDLDAPRLHEMLSDESEVSRRGSVTTRATEETAVDRPDVPNYDF